MQQLLVSPNTPYHQDFEQLLVQPVDYNIRNRTTVDQKQYSWILTSLLTNYVSIEIRSKELIVFTTIYEKRAIFNHDFDFRFHATLGDHTSILYYKDHCVYNVKLKMNCQEFYHRYSSAIKDTWEKLHSYPIQFNFNLDSHKHQFYLNVTTFQSQSKSSLFIFNKM